MQSYLQGLITGILLALTFLIFSANKKKATRELSKTYREKIINIEDRIGMLEGSVNDRFRLTGENFIYLKDKLSISVNSDFDFKVKNLSKTHFLINKTTKYCFNMKKLFKWTIYLMIFFLVSLIVYFYMWWSFKPPEEKQFAKSSQNHFSS